MAFYAEFLSGKARLSLSPPARTSKPPPPPLLASIPNRTAEGFMDNSLSRDEFEALEQVSRAKPSDKPNACIARNAKRLIGIKMLQHRKNGSYELTEKGAEAVFIKHCIAGLRAVDADAGTKLDSGTSTFLARKGYVIASSAPDRFEITDKGRECLADIDLSAGNKT